MSLMLEAEVKNFLQSTYSFACDLSTVFAFKLSSMDFKNFTTSDPSSTYSLSISRCSNLSLFNFFLFFHLCILVLS